MAAHLPQEQLALLVDVLEANRIVAYIATGSLALLVCDYLQTFPEELRYMWGSANSIPKFLFLVLRYYTFVHSSFSQSYHNDFSLTGTQCLSVFYRDTYSALVVSILCETIAYTRLYAFSGRNVYVTVLLVTFFIVGHSLQLWFLSRFLRTVQFSTFPVENRFGLCMVTFLMIFIGVRRNRVFGAKGLVRVFYRDGIFYFITLALLSVANVIFTYTAPTNGLQFAMIQIQVHMNACLAARMLLHLREYAAGDIIDNTYAMDIRPTADADRTIRFAVAPPPGITGGSTTTSWMD